mgnify:CR=1 FL=1
MSELARLMGFEAIKKENERGKNQEGWSKRASTHFTNKVKRGLLEQIDKMVSNEYKSEISQWCEKTRFMMRSRNRKLQKCGKGRPRWRTSHQAEEEMCVGDIKEGMSLHKPTWWPHNHHNNRGIQRCDEEVDEVNKEVVNVERERRQLWGRKVAMMIQLERTRQRLWLPKSKGEE